MDDPYRSASTPDPSFLLDRRCLFCGGRIAEASRRCVACGAPPSLELLSGQERTVRCPRCDHALSGVRLARALIFQCERCRGTFVAGGDWSEILNRLTAGELPLGDVGPPQANELTAAACFLDVPCPICRGETERALFADTADVRIDVCPSHGAWFDAGELYRALRRVKARDELVTGGEEAPPVALHLNLYERIARSRG